MKIKVNCKQCNKEFEIYPCRKGITKFCPKSDCYAKWRLENIRGKNHPSWKGKIKVSCEYCGKVKEVYPYEIKQGEKIFCDKKCYSLWQSKNIRGKNNHNWKEKIKINCAYCDKKLKVYPYITESRKNIFCPRSNCRAKWQSKNQKGRNSPSWLGGKSFEPYTTDWTETLRRSIRERDHYTCQLCDKLQGDIAHSVHHINYNKEDCNPKNLITLCVSCNSKVNTNRADWTKHFQGGS